MPIEFRCSGCDKLLRVPDANAGKQARCPECGRISQISAVHSPAARSSSIADTTAQISSDDPGFDAPSQPTSTAENPYAPPASVDPVMRPMSPSYTGFLLASRWKRFAGSILDGLVYIGGMVPGFVAIVLLGDGADEAAMLVAVLAMFGGLAVVAIYNWVLITRTGQSIAKRMLRMRIVTTDGELPGFVKGVQVRLWFTALINQFCGLFSLADALFIFGEPRRCIHDYMASTIVVEVTLEPHLVKDDLKASSGPEECPWCEEQVLLSSDGFCPVCNRPLA